MNTWIALFRGINVGGHRKLPMKELVAELEKLGLSEVTTYIQSGNAIFQDDDISATALSEKIASAIECRATVFDRMSWLYPPMHLKLPLPTAHFPPRKLLPKPYICIFLLSHKPN